ncbi:hypothetical protein AA309_27200 [Microvirga vignae]|uniref:Uncharacterized protein n=2 Tax=Microvirga vignae TaxID=1225564 RepID=A0A0H1RC56_9HYPH|nr:hypothetical protein AA309_27200 [Microvirga vignae]
MLWMTGIPISFAGTKMSPDEIEQHIIRAYLQLACTPEANGTRIVTVVRLGVLEARLTEVPEKQRLPGVPWFWLEIYSHASRSVIDSCGCTEFDEDELAQAVELITSARQQARGLH